VIRYPGRKSLVREEPIVSQRPILVADDIENRTSVGKKRSHAILSAASSLAQRLGSNITLLYVEDTKTYPQRGFDSSHFREWHDLHQERLAEMSRQSPVPTIWSLKLGSPAEQILKVLRAKTPPELVALGTQGKKGMKRLLIGSVAEEVVRHSKRPVMVIGPLAQEKDQNLSGKKQIKVLVATDLTRNSRAAEQYALSLAKRLGAQAVLFHCLWDSYNAILRPSMISGMVPLNIEHVLEKVREDTIATMQQKVFFFKDRGVACAHVIEEKAVPSTCAVFQEALQGYSHVVMGTRGRNALLSAFLGSTARETILNAPVPVIIVHSGK
jgi:nucleotide-binding universal stress UspA family protein